MKIDTRDARRLEKTLKSMSKHGVKFATAAAMNNAAFGARKQALVNIDREFITRNTWTKRSVQVRKGNTRNLTASVGSTQGYMRKQEFGGSERAGGRKGVAIPTSYSSGEGENAKPRRKLPRRPNKIKNITLKNSTGRARGRKQRNLVKVRQAAASKDKVIYMETQRRKGLYRVTGGKRKPKVKLIHDMSRKKIKINKRPWLGPATRVAARRIPADYKKKLLDQIDRAALRNGLVSKN